MFRYIFLALMARTGEKTGVIIAHLPTPAAYLSRDDRPHALCHLWL